MPSPNPVSPAPSPSALDLSTVVASESIAQAILKLSEAADALRKSGLSRRALRVLLHDATKVSVVSIDRILDALPTLKSIYTIPMKPAARGKS